MAEGERGLVCCFCGAGFGYDGEEPKEAILKEACDHEAKCPKNPYLAKIAQLVKSLKTAYFWMDLPDMVHFSEKEKDQTVEDYRKAKKSVCDAIATGEDI